MIFWMDFLSLLVATKQFYDLLDGLFVIVGDLTTLELKLLGSCSRTSQDKANDQFSPLAACRQATFSLGPSLAFDKAFSGLILRSYNRACWLCKGRRPWKTQKEMMKSPTAAHGPTDQNQRSKCATVVWTPGPKVSRAATLTNMAATQCSKPSHFLPKGHTWAYCAIRSQWSCKFPWEHVGASDLRWLQWNGFTTYMS